MSLRARIASIRCRALTARSLPRVATERRMGMLDRRTVRRRNCESVAFRSTDNAGAAPKGIPMTRGRVRTRAYYRTSAPPRFVSAAARRLPGDGRPRELRDAIASRLTKFSRACAFACWKRRRVSRTHRGEARRRHVDVHCEACNFVNEPKRLLASASWPLSAGLHAMASTPWPHHQHTLRCDTTWASSCIRCCLFVR